eukprot:TRINITY_DN518_c1_g1_i1.p1 TRINITY_DN518_c1_g1~~TRINITY_DN518_c1_g1_i1.p1  ORF type:complete len:130 (+),score=24.74 TRINITY_DN518_c1_g1_i1:250-639(+)
MSLDKRYLSEKTHGPRLFAMSSYFALQCDKVNREYFMCKKDDENPETCLKQGANVLECTENVIRVLENDCLKLVDSYAECLNQHTFRPRFCRKQQKSLVSCGNNSFSILSPSREDKNATSSTTPSPLHK